MAKQLEGLDELYNDDKLKDFDWPDEDSSGKVDIVEQIAKLQESYKGYCDAVDKYLDDVILYKKELGTYNVTTLPGYNQQVSNYGGALNSFATAFEKDLGDGSLFSFAVSNLPPSVTTSYGNRTLTANEISNKANSTASAVTVLRVAQHLLGDIAATDLLDPENLIRTKAAAIAAAIAATAGTGKTLSTSGQTETATGLKDLFFGYSFTFTATYTYNIPDATITAAQTLTENPHPGAAPTPPSFTPDKDETTQELHVTTYGQAAATAFLVDDNEETTSDYEAALATLYAALETAGTVVFNIVAKDGGSIVSGELNIPKARSDPTTATKVIALTLDPASLPVPAGASFGLPAWTVALGDGASSIITAIDLSNGDLTITINTAATGNGTVTVRATCTDTSVDPYTASIASLTLTVNVIDTLAFKSSPLVAEADSTSNDVSVPHPGVEYADGAVTYRIEDGSKSDPWDDRISVNAATGAVVIKKDTNAGDYEFTVIATDAKGYTAELLVKLTVTNDNDDRYAELLERLVDVQRAVDELLVPLEEMEKENPGTVKPEIIAQLKLFTAPVKTLKDTWNNGSPALNTTTLADSLDDLINLIDDETVKNTLKLLTDGIRSIPYSGSINKDFAINGTSFLGNQIIPSPFETYVWIVEKAWGAYNNEVAPLTDLLNAYNSLNDFVSDTDYADLTSVSDVNAYIQELYAKYAALDEALNAFARSDGLVKTIVEGILEHSKTLLAGAVEGFLAEDVQQSIAALIAANIENQQLAEAAAGLLEDAFSELKSLASSTISELPEITLTDIVAWSAEVRTALEKAAGASALIAGAADLVEDFNFNDYLLDELDDLDDFIAAVYGDYLDAVDNAAGDNGALAAALQAQIEALKARVLADPDVAEAIEIYNDIVRIWDLAERVVDYFESGEAQADYEKAKEVLVEYLKELRDEALAELEEYAQDKYDELVARIDALIDRLEQAALDELHEVIEEVKAELEKIREEVKAELEKIRAELEEFYENVEDVIEDATAAYQELEEFWDKVEAAWDKAEATISQIEDLYQLIEDYDWDAAKERLIDEFERLEDYLEDYLESEAAELIAKVDALIDELEDATEAELRELLERAREELEELWQEAIEQAKIIGDAAAEAIDEAIRDLPNPRIVRVDHNGQLSNRDGDRTASFTEAVYSGRLDRIIWRINRLLEVKGQSERIEADLLPVSLVELPDGFALEDGQLEVTDRELFKWTEADGASSTRVYTIKLQLTSGVAEIDALLKRYLDIDSFGEREFPVTLKLDPVVTLALPSDKTVLEVGAPGTIEAITTIGPASKVYNNATVEIELLNSSGATVYDPTGKLTVSYLNGANGQTPITIGADGRATISPFTLTSNTMLLSVIASEDAAGESFTYRVTLRDGTTVLARAEGAVSVNLLASVPEPEPEPSPEPEPEPSPEPEPEPSPEPEPETELVPVPGTERPAGPTQPTPSTPAPPAQTSSSGTAASAAGSSAAAIVAGTAGGAGAVLSTLAEAGDGSLLAELTDTQTPLTSGSSSAADAELTQIADADVPLAAQWAMVNLLFTLISVVLAFALAVHLLTYRRKSKGGGTGAQVRSGNLWRIPAIVLGFVSVVVFLLTEDVTQPWTFTDNWSSPMAVIVGVQIVLTLAMWRWMSRPAAKKTARTSAPAAA
ncbi:MAG: hypothetical protein LBP28_02625 [Coriobacteriales bacterium]|jgi:ElaB/YqjD/DUF883 family membrane-anchored ribosome-binding protein|nr:hypothetical protein [Coriobacteriales bacterium]